MAVPEVHAVPLQLARTVQLAGSIRRVQLRNHVRQDAARAACAERTWLQPRDQAAHPTTTQACNNDRPA